MVTPVVWLISPTSRSQVQQFQSYQLLLAIMLVAVGNELLPTRGSANGGTLPRL